MNRRHLLQAGAGTFAAALASRMFSFERLAHAAPPAGKKAKSVIVVWLNGGPSHIDTFDPKPGTPTGGSFKAIKTAIKGVSFSEHLPKLAAAAGHLAVLHGMTSKEGNHDRARYLLHTGYAPNPTVVHPSLGGWVSQELGAAESELPAFVSVNGPSMGAGFLGVQHGPFAIPKAGSPPANIAFARNVDDGRFGGRLEALAMMEKDYAEKTGDPQVTGRRAVYAQTVRMMKSPKVKVFDLSEESEKTKAAYGDTDFGRGCLLARRLVETGVRCVEVTLDGWDTHKDGFARIKTLSGALDAGLAGLLADLKDRKLLDETVVACLGDFGRTPRVNDDDGRDHYPQAWSALLAGGGIRGGVVHGKTDDAGAKVVESPTTVADFMATIVSRLGMEPDKSFTTPIGRPISITENGKPIAALVG